MVYCRLAILTEINVFRNKNRKRFGISFGKKYRRYSYK